MSTETPPAAEPGGSREIAGSGLRGNSFSNGPCTLSNGPIQLAWNNVMDPPFESVLRYG
jgi:hypothetical protein